MMVYTVPKTFAFATVRRVNVERSERLNTERWMSNVDDMVHPPFTGTI